VTPAEEAKRKKSKQYRDAAKARAVERIIIGLDFGTTYLGKIDASFFRSY
jgi:hypothetical protein